MQESNGTEQMPYVVTVDANEYVIRVKRDVIARDDLARMFDALLFSSIRRRSQATEEEISALAADVKRAAWKRVEHLFPAPSAS